MTVRCWLLGQTITALTSCSRLRRVGKGGREEGFHSTSRRGTDRIVVGAQRMWPVHSERSPDHHHRHDSRTKAWATGEGERERGERERGDQDGEDSDFRVYFGGESGNY